MFIQIFCGCSEVSALTGHRAKPAASPNTKFPLAPNLSAICSGPLRQIPISAICSSQSIHSTDSQVTIQRIHIIQQQYIRHSGLFLNKFRHPLFIISRVEYINLLIMTDEERNHGIRIAVFNQYKLSARIRISICNFNQRMQIIQK